MRTLDRYIARTFLAACLLIMAVLAVLLSLFELIAQLEDVGLGGYGLGSALLFVLLTLPGRLLDLLPVATLLGGIVAIAGFMTTAYAGASTTTVGDQMELDAIAACVIGGTSLAGGKGNVLGVIIGALVIGTLINGMTLMSASEESKLIVRGTVLALAVWIDVRLNRNVSP